MKGFLDTMAVVVFLRMFCLVLDIGRNTVTNDFILFSISVRLHKLNIRTMSGVGDRPNHCNAKPNYNACVSLISFLLVFNSD